MTQEARGGGRRPRRGIELELESGERQLHDKRARRVAGACWFE